MNPPTPPADLRPPVLLLAKTLPHGTLRLIRDLIYVLISNIFLLFIPLLLFRPFLTSISWLVLIPSRFSLFLLAAFLM